MSFWGSHVPKGRKGEPSTPIGTSVATPSRNPVQSNPDLGNQHPTPASSSTKIRLSLLATAMVDALGGPCEFRPRFSFPFVDSMIFNQNFRLPPGVWTDDTSMTLCLAKSLATYRAPGSKQPGGFSPLHQLDLYSRWRQQGYLSAVGRCFDIGGTITQAIDIFDSNRPEYAMGIIRRELSSENYSGNGSLMRVLPIGLAYWRDETLARRYAQRSSETTHPNSTCVEACEVWTGAIVAIMKEATQIAVDGSGSGTVSLSKFTLLKYFDEFPYTDSSLLNALTLPPELPPRPQDESKIEEWYHRYHPILRVIRETQNPSPQSSSNYATKEFQYILPSLVRIPSTGYVVHSLVAALFCFFATKTFEEGALLAVNLGGDADTIGAIYAGLAGCWYAGDADEAEGIFWTKRVREWHDALVRRDLIERVADQLVSFEQRLFQET